MQILLVISMLVACKSTSDSRSYIGLPGSDQDQLQLTAGVSVLHDVLESSSETLVLEKDQVKVLQYELERLLDIKASEIGYAVLEKEKVIDQLATGSQEIAVSQVRKVVNERIALLIGPDRSRYKYDLHKLLYSGFPGRGEALLFKAFKNSLKGNSDYRHLIKEGFFADPQRAWMIYTNGSPILHKYLQRSSLFDFKDPGRIGFSPAVFQSFPFDAAPNDPHVKMLRRMYGSDARVTGLAKGSVALAYRIRVGSGSNRQDKVVKLPRYTDSQLRALLNEQLGEFNINEIMAIFPEESSGKHTPFEKDQKDEANRKKLLKNIETKVRAEIDPEVEERNLAALRKAYDGLPGVKIIEGRKITFEGIQFLETDYIPGKPLTQVEELPSDAAKKNLRDLLRGLYTHLLYSTGTYHDDVHPGNVMFTGKEFVLIDGGRVDQNKFDSDFDQKKLQKVEEFVAAIEREKLGSLEGEPKGKVFSDADAGRIRDIARKFELVADVSVTWRYIASELVDETREHYKGVRSSIISHFHHSEELGDMIGSETRGQYSLNPYQNIIKRLTAIELIDRLAKQYLDESDRTFFGDMNSAIELSKKQKEIQKRPFQKVDTGKSGHPHSPDGDKPISAEGKASGWWTPAKIGIAALIGATVATGGVWAAVRLRHGDNDDKDSLLLADRPGSGSCRVFFQDPRLLVVCVDLAFDQRVANLMPASCRKLSRGELGANWSTVPCPLDGVMESCARDHSAGAIVNTNAKAYVPLKSSTLNNFCSRISSPVQ